MTDLHTLLASVEKAEGADRGVDYVLANWFDHARSVPAYTASIDASLALVERMLPGAWVEGALASPAWIEIHNNDVLPALGGARATTPALAILSALLRALIAKGTENE